MTREEVWWNELEGEIVAILCSVLVALVLVLLVAMIQRKKLKLKPHPHRLTS